MISLHGTRSIPYFYKLFMIKYKNFSYVIYNWANYSIQRDSTFEKQNNNILAYISYYVTYVHIKDYLTQYIYTTISICHITHISYFTFHYTQRKNVHFFMENIFVIACKPIITYCVICSTFIAAFFLVHFLSVYKWNGLYGWRFMRDDMNGNMQIIWMKISV